MNARIAPSNHVAPGSPASRKPRRRRNAFLRRLTLTPPLDLRKAVGPALCGLWLLACAFSTPAASFPGNAHIEISDTNGSLSWKTNLDKLSVLCWFKLSAPSGSSLGANMSILCNKRSAAGYYAYHLFFDAKKRSIEFSTAGTGNPHQFTLINRPYPERWYHVAVSRDSTNFFAYVDGANALTNSRSVGDSGNTNGVIIGGGDPAFATRDFCGDVQEVAIYRQALSRAEVQARMFTNQESAANLLAYYKLGYSTNADDFYKNFASTNGEPRGKLAGSGQLLFEETDRKGEQSLFDSQVNGGRNAIAPLSGVFSWQHAAFGRAVPGIPFEFNIAYCPGLSSSLGPGWSHPFESKVTWDGFRYQLYNWQGGSDAWESTNNNPGFVMNTTHGEYRGELTTDPDSNVVWTNAARLTHWFSRPGDTLSPIVGRLLKVRDPNGNSMMLKWDDAPLGTGLLTNVLDSVSNSYRFYYVSLNTQWFLTNMTSGDWQVLFAYSNNINSAAPLQYLLVSKTLTNTSGFYSNLNTTLRFSYNTNGLLERITDARGNTNVIVHYDDYYRQIETINALGQVTRTEYAVPGPRQVRKTDAAGFQWIDTCDRKGRVTVQRNPLGCETRCTYDAHGNRASVTDAKGNITYYGYDSRGNLLAQTNALGEVSANAYHPYFNKPLTKTDSLGWTTHYDIDDATGNVLRQYDGYGTGITNTYRPDGLLLAQTNANGYAKRFFYNTNGFRVAEVDEAGFTNSYQLNDVGWTLAATNPLHEVTTYAYDLNGKVVRTVDPLNRTNYATYDPNGNQLTQTDAKGQTSTNVYDALNRKIKETDRTGATTWFAYTVRGKQAAVTNAIGFVTTFSYDPANGQTNRTDALGNAVTTVFDSNGNEISTIDKLGQRWTKTYDPLNRVIAESDPFGNTTQTLYDPAGRVREAIGPDGSRTSNFYDLRGRLTNRVDAAGSKWSYSYDSVGNILSVTDALGHQYVMFYSNRNERILEQNQDGKQWSYIYDALGRLSRQEEPNGTIRWLTYDPGGRLTMVGFSSHRTNYFAYDANDNPTDLMRSGSGLPARTQLDYDALDRVRWCSDAFSNSVSYTYDPGGRLTNLIYPDGKTLAQNYDPLDRLTNQVFQFGSQSFVSSYAYNEASRLVRRTYPNGMVQTNTFDAAGRLTGVSQSLTTPQSLSLNAALAYAYDGKGNTTRSQSQGIFEWPVPALRDEMASYTSSGQVTNRDILITDVRQPSIAYRYDPNGNMTNASASDGSQSWLLTYDEDNRTTCIRWDAGITSKVVTNRYDALGRRIARTVNGLETRYVLNLAGGMERILCDALGNGFITAWYVHGPDLAYKVDARGGLTCYHADAQGNVIALTGANGTKLIEYAYTPYGRSLGSTNYIADPSLDTQPFLFVGSQGVMMEERGIPGLYFMRARYYSAEAGVFLSTDPEKNIGPTWLPIAYAYAQCNPLKYGDPNGRFLNFLAAALGALSGAVIGAISDAVFQGVDNLVALAKGKQLPGWNWKQFGMSVATGAVLGAVGGLTMGAGLAVMAAAGAVAGAGMSYVSAGVQDSGNWTDPKAIAINLAIGAATGAVGGLVEGLQAEGQAAARAAVRSATKGTRQELMETMAARGTREELMKGTGTSTKQLLREMPGPRNLPLSDEGRFSWQEFAVTAANETYNYFMGNLGGYLQSQDGSRGDRRDSGAPVTLPVVPGFSGR